MSKLKDSRNEIRDMTPEAAVKRLAELRFNLFNLRMQLSRGEVKDTRQFSQTRKDIARLTHKLHLEHLETQQGFAVTAEADDTEVTADTEATDEAAATDETVPEAEAAADAEDETSTEETAD